MNYYIQGNKEKADQIKAAFEAKGYDISWPGGLAEPNVINIGVERNGAKYVVAETAEYIRDLIKTHPDYKELELPVEPKFKVGDWLYHNTLGVHPILVKDYSKALGYEVECISFTYYLQKGVIENEYHLWSIADAKDGDVICTPNNNIFIYKCKGSGAQIYDYCGLYHGKFEPDSSSPNGAYNSCDGYAPATKEQRDLLFQKMKEAGYEWDADKKELRKIKPHYNIANFQPFQKVLVRQDDSCTWGVSFFGRYDGMFLCCSNVCFAQCIPFNEDTKHLLGTTDPCDEQYINW